MIISLLRRFSCFLFLLTLILCAATPPIAAADRSAEEQFETLRKQFEDAKAEFFAEYERAQTAAERERITAPYPAMTMVDDFLKLESAHRGTQVGISALHQLVSQA